MSGVVGPKKAAPPSVHSALEGMGVLSGEAPAAQPTRGPRAMRDHSAQVEWLYVVPPANTQRITIMQRQDGPFRRDAIGGRGHYYTSLEELVQGRWQHVDGSATGGHACFELAYEIAEERWLAAIAKAGSAT